MAATGPPVAKGLGMGTRAFIILVLLLVDGCCFVVSFLVSDYARVPLSMEFYFSEN
jgi:hypothetical protein